MEPGKEIPPGYRLLAPGAIVAVPEVWYEITLGRCKGKSASYTLTAITNGLIRPWEVRKGGTSAYDGTPLEPVIDALKLFGVTVVNKKRADVTHSLNQAFSNLRRRLKLTSCLQASTEWLSETGRSPDFEQLSFSEMDQTLTQFYSTASLHRENLRHYPSFLTNYLSAAPFWRQVDLQTHPSFETSRNVISCLETGRKRQISQQDLNRLYESGVLSNDNPISLQNKVWVEIMIYFGGLGRQKLRRLEKQHFLFEKDVSGQLYCRLQAPGLGTEKTEVRVYEQVNNKYCPVQSLKLYLSKLNHGTTCFFQQPLPDYHKDPAVWYSHRPIGKNIHSTWLATICKEAGVPTAYVNSSLYNLKTPNVKKDVNSLD